MTEFSRVAEQALDAESEERLSAINERMAGLFEDEDAAPTRPIVLVVGQQRSGSTLVSQTVCMGCEVGYPSNLIARFWRAPVAGAWLQRALRAQLGSPQSEFTSVLGTTPSLLEPHEFSYFWNDWFPGETSCRDAAGFVKVMGNLERAFAAPLVFKNVFNSLRVELLARLLPTALFIVVRRSLLDVACSTLASRRKRYGDPRAFFGVRPPSMGDIDGLAPAEQIAEQLFATEATLAEGLAAVDGDRVIELDYREFCAAPEAALASLQGRGIGRRGEVALPASFRPTDWSTHDDAPVLAAALRRRFAGSELGGGYLP